MIVLGQLPHCSELVLDITLKLRKQAFAAARPAPLQSLLDCAGMSDRHLTLSLSETHTRKYWWCSPPKMGTANV